MATNREAARRPLFTIDGANWLQYGPLRHHSLPELVYANPNLGDDETDAVFVRRNRKGRSGSVVLSPAEVSVKGKRDDEEEVMFRRRLYRLEWAGMHHRGADDSLPCELLQHWGGRVAEAARGALMVSEWARMPMDEVLHMRIMDNLLHELPETVAYHAAVAKGWGTDEYPVGNLPGPVVHSVVDARFAPDANYRAAMTYLKWLAETHWEHPLLIGGGFDTAVRERLTEISVEATRLYFYMIGDTLYDNTTRYYARGELSQWWNELATYLFWVGRTGRGLYERFAGWPDRDDEHHWTQFMQDIPGLAERVRYYSETGQVEGRRLARADGQDPACMTTSDGEGIDESYLVVFLPELERLLRDKDAQGGLSARMILDVLYPQDGVPARYQDLRDCIERLTRCTIGARPDGLRLAKYMAKQRGKTVQGRQLQRGAPEGGSAGPIRWLVRRVGETNADV